MYTTENGVNQSITATDIATGPVTFDAISFMIRDYDPTNKVGEYCYTATIPELDIAFNINCVYK